MEELVTLESTGRCSIKTIRRLKTLARIALYILLTEFPEEEEDIDEYNTEETMTEESGEEESDTRKVKVMKRKAKGALKSKGKVSISRFSLQQFVLHPCQKETGKLRKVDI